MKPCRFPLVPPCCALPAALVLAAVLAGSCARQPPPGVRQDSLQRYLEGRRLYNEQRFDEALHVLRDNHRRDPGFSGNSYLIGKIYFFSEDYAQARSYWETTLRGNPHHLDARKWLARLHLLEERPEAAEALIVTALADSAEDPELLTLLGKARRARGDLAGAIESYTKARVLAERLAEASLELAELYREFGMPERAAAELERAAALLPEGSSLSRAVRTAAEELRRE